MSSLLILGIFYFFLNIINNIIYKFFLEDIFILDDINPLSILLFLEL